MAAVIQGAAAAVGWMIQGDLLYIYFARNYFPQYERWARYFEPPATAPATIPYARETPGVPRGVKVDEIVESLVTSVESVTITITKTTSTLQTTTSTQTTTATQTETTTTTSTALQLPKPTTVASSPKYTPPTTTSTQDFETTAAESNAMESQETPTALRYDLVDCNFPLLYMGASMLQLPYDISVQVGLDKWEPATQQLSELRRLVELHKTSLLKQHGPQKLDDLLSGLNTLVEEPLKVGCFLLKHLQGTLVELTTNRKGRRSDRQAAVRTILQEVESQLEDAIDSVGIGRFLPAWARAAPELRSPNCPGNECFVLGISALEIFTRGNLQKFLDGVKDLKTRAEYKPWLVIKGIFWGIAKIYTELLEEIFVLVDWHLLALTFLIFALSFPLVVYVMRQWKHEYEVLGLGPRLRLPVGGGQYLTEAGGNDNGTDDADDQDADDQDADDQDADDQDADDQDADDQDADDQDADDQDADDQDVDNQGVNNQGVDDQGADNQGVDDQGVNNQGVDNQGVDNQGVDNQGVDDQGADNQGVDDQGVNNQGVDNQGVDDQGVNNQGVDNQGADNQGVDNQGVDDQGADNQGVDNQGVDDQGVNNQGVDDQGVDDQGVDDQAVDDQAAEDQAVDNQEVADRAADNQVVDDPAVDDQAAEDQAVDNQEVADRAADNQVVDDPAVDDQAAEDQTVDGQEDQGVDRGRGGRGGDTERNQGNQRVDNEDRGGVEGDNGEEVNNNN